MRDIKLNEIYICKLFVDKNQFEEEKKMNDKIWTKITDIEDYYQLYETAGNVTSDMPKEFQKFKYFLTLKYLNEGDL